MELKELSPSPGHTQLSRPYEILVSKLRVKGVHLWAVTSLNYFYRYLFLFFFLALNLVFNRKNQKKISSNPLHHPLKSLKRRFYNLIFFFYWLIPKIISIDIILYLYTWMAFHIFYLGAIIRKELTLIKPKYTVPTVNTEQITVYTSSGKNFILTLFLIRIRF